MTVEQKKLKQATWEHLLHSDMPAKEFAEELNNLSPTELDLLNQSLIEHIKLKEQQQWEVTKNLRNFNKQSTTAKNDFDRVKCSLEDTIEKTNILFKEIFKDSTAAHIKCAAYEQKYGLDATVSTLSFTPEVFGELQGFSLPLGISSPARRSALKASRNGDYSKLRIAYGQGMWVLKHLRKKVQGEQING